MSRLRRVLVAVRHDAGLSLILVIQATIMFVVAPMSATRLLSPPVVDAFRFGLAAAAVLTVTRSRIAIGLILASFAVSIALAQVMRTGAAATAVELARLAFTTLFDLIIAIVVARVAFGPGPVTVHRILGGVILYLSIGLIFANLYRTLALTDPAAFTGLSTDRRQAFGEILYFSLGALTTGGSPSIAPLHPFARSLANLESVIGQLYPPTLLARLVSLHAARDVGENAAEPEPLAGSARIGAAQRDLGAADETMKGPSR